MPIQTQTSTFPALQESSTGQETVQPGSTSPDVVHNQPSTSGFSYISMSSAYRCPPEPDNLEFDLPHLRH